MTTKIKTCYSIETPFIVPNYSPCCRSPRMFWCVGPSDGYSYAVFYAFHLVSAAVMRLDGTPPCVHSPARPAFAASFPFEEYNKRGI